MAIDRIECMTLDTLPLNQPGEVQVQLNMLKHLALHPDIFRLVFFHLPADIRLHAKHALVEHLQKEYEVQSLNIADFTQELIAAIRKGAWISDLKHYEEAPVLVVDDLQFITGKESTQEAFYAGVLKPRLEKKLLTVLFSEQGYTELSPVLRDDLRNLLKLGFHDLDLNLTLNLT